MSNPVEAAFERCGAILRGHFRLSSGRHSDIYFQKFRVLERPDELGPLCAVLASRWSAGVTPAPDPRSADVASAPGYLATGEENGKDALATGERNGQDALATGEVDWVAAPTIGGMLIGYEVGRALGKPVLYVEQEDGKRTLRRGQDLRPGQRVLVVDDVLTTGLSVIEVVDYLKSCGAIIAGIGVLVDRSSDSPNFGTKFEALWTVRSSDFAADDCPLCAQGIPIQSFTSRGRHETS